MSANTPDRDADRPLSDVIDTWLRRLTNEGRSTATLGAYERVAADLLARLAAIHGVAARDVVAAAVTTDELEQTLADWLVEPDGRRTTNPRPGTGRSNATVRARVAAIRSLFAYAYGADKIPADPAARVKPPKRTKTLPVSLEGDEAQRLLGDGQAQSAWPERDALIVALGAVGGLRLAEITELRMTDLRGNPPEAMVVRGKGSKQREVPIAPLVAEALAAYLPTRRARLDALGLKADTVVISSRGRDDGAGGRTVARARYAVEYAVSAALRRLGLRREGANVHLLRHTFATLGLRSGALNLRQLQEILGHESVETTQLYTHVNRDELVDGIRLHPLAAAGGE